MPDKKVLICDDEPYILESVSFIVREEGYQVLTAGDGEQALQLLSSERPDLVLLDIAGTIVVDVLRDALPIYDGSEPS